MREYARIHRRGHQVRGVVIIEVLILCGVALATISILSCVRSAARDTARDNESKSNSSQVFKVHRVYNTDHGHYWTGCPSNLASTKINGDRAFATGANVEAALLAWQGNAANSSLANTQYGVQWGEGSANHDNALAGALVAEFNVPYTWTSDNLTSGPNAPGLGTFRFPNTYTVSRRVNGPYNDIFFAPKDEIVIDWLRELNCFDNMAVPCQRVGEAIDLDGGWRNYYQTKDGYLGGMASSYCLSPAGMLNPKVYMATAASGPIDPMSMPSGFRSPSSAQARYPSLKTFLCEHHHLQNNKFGCSLDWPTSGRGAWMNPRATGAWHYDGCAPYLFNGHWDSSPVVTMQDGSTHIVGVTEVRRSDAMVKNEDGNGLWCRYTADGTNGYFMEYNRHGQPDLTTSFHTHTYGGMQGRDFVAH